MFVNVKPPVALLVPKFLRAGRKVVSLFEPTIAEKIVLGRIFWDQHARSLFSFSDNQILVRDVRFASFETEKIRPVRSILLWITTMISETLT